MERCHSIAYSSLRMAQTAGEKEMVSLWHMQCRFAARSGCDFNAADLLVYVYALLLYVGICIFGLPNINYSIQPIPRTLIVPLRVYRGSVTIISVPSPTALFISVFAR